MAFTNVWDNTFPPDSQQANLLGQDIRTLKSDLQQRCSAFAAGLLSARPTPDAATGVPAQGWGVANGGVMYFATDTGQVFYWNGSAWIDVTKNFLFGSQAFKATTLVNLTGTTVKTTIYTVNIPVGIATTTSVFRITAYFRQGAIVGGPGGLTLNFGGFPVIVNFGISAITGAQKLEVVISNQNVTNSQTFDAWLTEAPPAPGNVTGMAFNGSGMSIDTTLAIPVVLQYQNLNNADLTIFNRMIVELL